MEFNTTTGIWPKIKEYIDSKLSSTGGGVLRIIDHPLNIFDKEVDTIDLWCGGPNSNASSYILIFAKTANIYTGYYKSTAEYQGLLHNVLAYISPSDTGRIKVESNGSDNNYKETLFGFFYNHYGTSDSTNKVVNRTQDYLTLKRYASYPSDLSYWSYNSVVALVSSYPEEEQGTIYNGFDDRFWNNKMQYVTNTGNLIS